MMVEELSLLPSEENPVKNALVTFVSFVLFGSVPIAPFICWELFDFGKSYDENILFDVSTYVTWLFLFLLGAIKA